MPARLERLFEIRRVTFTGVTQHGDSIERDAAARFVLSAPRALDRLVHLARRGHHRHAIVERRLGGRGVGEQMALQAAERGVRGSFGRDRRGRASAQRRA